MVPRDDASSQIAKFIGESRSADAPALYFTHPQQLFDMLQDLEEKNLEALLQCTKLQPSLVYVQSGRYTVIVMAEVHANIPFIIVYSVRV